jgi:hypothetical protein
MSFLKATFPHAGRSEFLVLTSSIPGMIVFQKEEAKAM